MKFIKIISKVQKNVGILFFYISAETSIEIGHYFYINFVPTFLNVAKLLNRKKILWSMKLKGPIKTQGQNDAKLEVVKSYTKNSDFCV